MKYNTNIKIFRYNDGNEILNNEYVYEINNLMDVSKFQQENMIVH